MQRTERYAAVALMFFVAILIVGYFWDDGASEAPSEVLAAESGQSAEVRRVDEEAVARQRAQEERMARVRRARSREADDPQGSGPVGSDASSDGNARGMLMSGQDDVPEGYGRVTTATIGAGHRTTPGGPVAQGPEELKGLSKPLLDSPMNDGSSNLGEPVVMSSLNERMPRKGRRGRDASVAPETTRKSSASKGSAAKKSEGSLPKSSGSQTAANGPVAIKKTYTVQSGDALQRIAKRELGDASRAGEIAALNGLNNPDMIVVGMQLTLPAPILGATRIASESKPAGSSTSTSSASSPASRTEAPRPGAEYTIRSGESLSIALHRELGTYKRSIDLVKALNPGLNPDKVRAGQKIRLPLPGDIPGPALPKSMPKKSPSLSTSTAGSRLADASGPRTSSATGARRARKDSEFVVR